MTDRFAWINGLPLEKAVATLSEGFCPRCGGRVTLGAPFELDDEPTPDAEAFAQGGCTPCGFWIRAGHGGSDPDRDWFAITMLNADALMTLSLNPPADDEDEDLDDWDDDEIFEDY